MAGQNQQGFSRRERQIMDVIYAREHATAIEVRVALPDPPSYSAVRALLKILENKGQLQHRAVKGKYVYTPVRRRAHAGRGALRGVLKTFFDNSALKAVAALLDASDTELTDADLDELSDMIDRAKKRGAK